MSIVSDDLEEDIETLHVPAAKHKRYWKKELNHEDVSNVTDLASDSDDGRAKKKPRAKTRQSDSAPIKLEDDGSVIDLVSDSDDEKAKIKRKAKTQSASTKPAPSKKQQVIGGTKVTRQVTVELVQIITSIPPSWTVPHSPMAYLLDLTDDDHTYVKDNGESHTMSSLIRHEVALF
jgi:hypothetical protein